jgi:hypothetical protein
MRERYTVAYLQIPLTYHAVGFSLTTLLDLIIWFFIASQPARTYYILTGTRGMGARFPPWKCLHPPPHTVTMLYFAIIHQVVSDIHILSTAYSFFCAELQSHNTKVQPHNTNRYRP